MIVHLTFVFALLTSAVLYFGAEQVARGWGDPSDHKYFERQPPPTLPAPVPMKDAVRIGIYATMRSRPLFSPDRRPFTPRREPRPAAKAATPEVQGPQPPQVSLMGVVSQGSDGLAVLSLHRTGETVYVKVGDKIEDWRVESVNKDRVVLTNGSLTEIIELY